MAPPAINSVTTLAARQHGVVSSMQLRDLGWSTGQIKSSVRSGWLAVVHRGVYAVAHPTLSVRGRLSAAALACGPGSYVSHRAAAVLWQLVGWVGDPVDVSVEARHVRSRPGIRVHRIGSLHPRDRRIHHGIPVTSPSLAILDLAAVNAELAAKAWNEALLQRLSSQSEMATLLGRRNGHHGTSAIRQLLAASDGGFSRQEAERIMIGLIREAGLPEPLRNARIHGFELDFYWPELRLNVEVDGYRWHSTRARLNRDRERDAELMGHGVRVLRISYDQLARPGRVVAHLAAAIALARGQ